MDDIASGAQSGTDIRQRLADEFTAASREPDATLDERVLAVAAVAALHADAATRDGGGGF